MTFKSATMIKVATFCLPLVILTACASTPEPEVVEITPDPIHEGCYPIASLEKVVIPAEYKTVRGATIIESPSEYYKDPDTGEMVEIKQPPIEEVQEYQVKTKEEEIYYETPQGVRTTDICENYPVGSEENPAPAPAPTE
jgi:hypothetical protein